MREKPSNEELKAEAEKLIQAIDAKDQDAINSSLEEISSLHDNSLFMQLGRLTREFHNNLNEYEREHFEKKLGDKELPDAGDRLQHVMDLTQDAANKTLAATEKCMDVLDQILKTSEQHADKASEALVKELENQVEQLKSLLTEILMAQEYQDLSGQILKKVMTLVSSLHVSLVTMLGEAAHIHEKSPSGEEKPLTSQDDVDDLLASLGF